MAFLPSFMNDKNIYGFPDDYVEPEVKEKKTYGLAIGKAIWSHNLTYDTHLFYNDRENYDKYIKYALGRQSESDYHPFMGIAPEASKKEWTKAINFQIKNYATKRINIALSKIMNKRYDCGVDAVDPIARNIRKNLENYLRLNMKFRKEIAELEAQFGVELVEQVLPRDEEELQMMLEMDYRIPEAVHLELAVPWHLNRNKYDQELRRQVNFDMFVLGPAVVYCGLNENMMPDVERVNPSDLIVPYNETPNFERVPYIARLKWVTEGDFRKMATGFLKESEIKDVIKNYAKRPSEDAWPFRTTRTGDDIRRDDDISKVPLLHYNYRSPDTVVYVMKPDALGNPMLFKKSINYYAEEGGDDKFNGKFNGSRRIIRKSMNAVYEGWWVIGSEYVIRHFRRSYQMNKYGLNGHNGMGFKIFAPNSWNGMMVSTGSEMIPNLDELQRYNLKLQQIVSRAIPKGVGLDLYALRQANLSWGGKQMTDQEKIEMFMRAGIFVFSSKDRYAAGSNYKPFYESENGLANDIEKYLRLIQQSLFELDEIIGFNKASSAGTLRPDTGKAVAEIQVEGTETALDYLYNADKQIYTSLCQELSVLHIKSYKFNPVNKERYDSLFGLTGINNDSINFDTFEYDFNVEARPTEKEWAEIYLSAEKAYDKGILTYSDTLYLREINSIKQARRWLMMKESQAMKRAEQSAQANQQQNIADQQQSAMIKGQVDAQLEDKKLQNALILEEAKKDTIAYEGNVKIAVAERTIKLQGEVDRGAQIKNHQHDEDMAILEDELAEDNQSSKKEK